MTKLWYDGWGNITITATDGSSVTVSEKDQAELLQLMTDGRCAICLTEISIADKLCCECLSSILQYHRNQHACIK